MVTGPLIFVAIMEALIERGFNDVEGTVSFAVHRKDGASDNVDLRGAGFEEAEIDEDAEVRGDPCTARTPRKLMATNSHRKSIFLSTCGVESGGITGLGHFGFDDGSAQNGAPSMKLLRYPADI